MRIHHLRNATCRVDLGEHRLLVDPMLSEPGTLPGFRVLGGGRCRNPLVALPGGAEVALAEATGAIVTHEHPDHLDPAGLEWLRGRRLPVWAAPVDVPGLRRKGLAAEPLVDGALGLGVEAIPARHGPGLVGWLMGPVHGLYLAHPDEPTVYLTSDATLTDAVIDALDRLAPDVVVAPAGAANFGAGPDILFSVDDLVTLTRRAPGRVVLNHLEALDHCPTTRADLRARMEAEGLAGRTWIPADGEARDFERPAESRRPARRTGSPGKPGLQKWLTAKFAGT